MHTTTSNGTRRVQVEHPDWSEETMVDFREAVLRDYAVDGSNHRDLMDTVVFMSDPGMVIVSGKIPGAGAFIEESLSGKRKFGVVDAAALNGINLAAAAFTFQDTPAAGILKDALDKAWGHNKRTEA